MAFSPLIYDMKGYYTRQWARVLFEVPLHARSDHGSLAFHPYHSFRVLINHQEPENSAMAALLEELAIWQNYECRLYYLIKLIKGEESIDPKFYHSHQGESETLLQPHGPW